MARAMFYMDVRYEGEAIEQEADLRLTSNIDQVKGVNAWKDGEVAFMGVLDDLLKWHQEDPVDDLERRRNTVVSLFQGNRNPFVDHPEWVDVVFGGGSTVVAEAWINEFHYDNVGADQGEFVEIVGPAGLDLSGWVVVGYNGNGGRRYKTIALTGSIADEGSGFGVLDFNFPGMQNGPPDGLALVDASGHVVEFISYEGRFTAADGPAAGMFSVDIGVSETPTTPNGHSLQRTGKEDWTGLAPATRGALNRGHTFPGS